MIKCRKHDWRVGAGIGEIVSGKIKATKICIWCWKCGKKIYAKNKRFELRRRKRLR